MAQTQKSSSETQELTRAMVVRTSTDLAQIEELEQILTSNVAPDVVDDPEQMSAEIVAQLLAAESDADLEGSPVPWGELEGVPFELRGFSWRPSDFEEGSAVYFIVRAVNRATGEFQLLTTGSRFVLAQLANMAKRGTLVGAVRELVKAERPTGRGFYPLRLRTPKGFAQTASGGEPSPAAEEKADG